MGVTRRMSAGKLRMFGLAIFPVAVVLVAPPTSSAAVHDQLYAVYTSSATPRHYKRAVAKSLKLPPPAQNAIVFSRPTVKSISLTTPRGSLAMQFICAASSCRPMSLRGVPIGSSVSVYSRTGTLIKTLGVDSTSTVTWDSTNQSGVAVAAGTYTVTVQGAGGTATFPVTLQ